VTRVLTLLANSQNPCTYVGDSLDTSRILGNVGQFASRVNTRVTSRKLARHALPVHSSRFLPWGQIAVDGARTDLQGLLNLYHGEATLMQ
jgi:thiamine pyrophosphate-dependent acetolactate synthase large subunit-like protein